MDHSTLAASGTFSVLFRGIASLLFVVTAGSCVERFDPEPANYKNVLVVEGHISNIPEPYTVRLSRTQPLNTNVFAPEPGANVSIIGPEGKSFTFTEVFAGTYRSNPGEFVGVEGQTYQLNIITPNGRHYQSASTLLRQGPPIDSVYYERDQRLTDEGGVLDGVKILVDSHDPTGNTRYYRYEWYETYQIKVPYPSPYTYDFERPWDPIIPADVFPQICYSSSRSSNILTTSTRQLKEDRISQFEVNFVSTESYRLKSLYSILVRQYAIDEKGFKYWDELQKASENQGTLFDAMPYELRGNVQNVGDPDEPVLGYFEASAASEKRLYISRDELLGLNYPSDGCFPQLSEAGFDEIPAYLNSGFLIAYLGPYPVTYVVMAPGPCADCRYHGTMEKPAFWPL